MLEKHLLQSGVIVEQKNPYFFGIGILTSMGIYVNEDHDPKI